MPINYNYDAVPADYKCDRCHLTGCKLWREYSVFSPRILCVDCAVQDQSRPSASSSFSKRIASGEVDFCEDGTYLDENGNRIDQIGWYVPAVPDEEGLGYWGYTSVPQRGINWWKRLPLMVKKG